MEGNIEDKRANKLLPWYKEEGLKIGILDVETTNLKPDFGVMLTWTIKEKDGGSVSGVVGKKELFNGTLDKRLVSDLLEELKKYKVVIGYYSNGFDIPYVRAKALHYDLTFPGFVLAEKRGGGSKYVPSLYSWDLYPVVKYKLNLSRNSLDSACSYLNIPGKTPIDKEVWRQGAYGDAESLKTILEHNIADCGITDQLHTKLCDFARWGKTSV
jgi:DNA polymerase III epsilon subunit-like protein